MNESSPNRKEVLQLELDLHKTEFTSLRDEILRSTDAERQALNLSLVAAGAGLSVVSFIDRQSLYTVILLFPFVFHVILWEMLNTLKAVSRISSYLTTVLVPRVNQVLDELGRERSAPAALGWEAYIARESMRPSQVVLTSLTPTRHWMPILAIAGLLGGYAILTRTNQHIPSYIELVLLVINLALLIWAAVQNIIILRTYMQKTRPAQPKPGPQPQKPHPAGKGRR
jgi:hypothetical protein